MAKEVFFSIETSLNVLKELFKEELISFDKQYDEFTLKFSACGFMLIRRMGVIFLKTKSQN